MTACRRPPGALRACSEASLHRTHRAASRGMALEERSDSPLLRLEAERILGPAVARVVASELAMRFLLRLLREAN